MNSSRKTSDIFQGRKIRPAVRLDAGAGRRAWYLDHWTRATRTVAGAAMTEVRFGILDLGRLLQSELRGKMEKLTSEG